jgi:hypothetical protein
MNYKNGLIEDTHYYKDGDRVVFTALFHIQRGQCCGNGCRHCPYEPQYKKGNLKVAEKFSILNYKENGSEKHT